MAWADLRGEVEELFGALDDDRSERYAERLEDRAQWMRARARDRLELFRFRRPTYWRDRARRLATARPAHPCVRCGAPLLDGRRSVCAAPCAPAGPFVVVLLLAEGEVRSAPVDALGTAIRIARGAAAWHQVEARIEAIEAIDAGVGVVVQQVLGS